VAKQEELAKEVMNIVLRSIFVKTFGFFTCRKIFTSHPKEGVLQISIALKNPSPSAGFETANLWSNGTRAICL
jgi:hypothetical protein